MNDFSISTKQKFKGYETAFDIIYFVAFFLGSM